MSYRAPVADIAFTLKHSAGLSQALGEGLYGDLTEADVDAVLEEAGKFASTVIAPLNTVGDKHGTPLKDGKVTMPPGWKEAYTAWAQGGWNGLAASADWGGQGLPHALNAACIEMWNSASMAFGIGPVLTMGAIEALDRHGADALKAKYLEKLTTGEWMGTMQLTEPQAGSDVGALRARADRAADGSYRITGSKIFITYGEHDLTDNIIHFVLARLPDAPPGTKGISLFLVPKFFVSDDGAIGERNDARCHSVEHKLGIHGSPTCTMVYGDNGGATGWLVGEENRGLNCMFTMMNNARLAVGLQGVAIAERATQQAMAYANDRRQGRAGGNGAIVNHPDVRRMLLTMRALTGAARAICYATGAAIDRSHLARDDAARKAADQRASLLTPIAKAFSTDIGTEVASLGVQVHGGMGFIEETGAAQHYRDARIAQIYEGHQRHPVDRSRHAQDPDDGRRRDEGLSRRVAPHRRGREAGERPGFRCDGHAAVRRGRQSRPAPPRGLLGKLDKSPDAALAGATPYLRLFASAAGGCALAEDALAASRLNGGADGGRVALARFFAENIAVQAGGLETTVTEGADSVSPIALPAA
jgi:alkylation response protein AidB-like acyl-CoA dehydrogenase